MMILKTNIFTQVPGLPTPGPCEFINTADGLDAWAKALAGPDALPLLETQPPDAGDWGVPCCLHLIAMFRALEDGAAAALVQRLSNDGRSALAGQFISWWDWLNASLAFPGYAGDVDSEDWLRMRLRAATRAQALADWLREQYANDASPSPVAVLTPTAAVTRPPASISARPAGLAMVAPAAYAAASDASLAAPAVTADAATIADAAPARRDPCDMTGAATADGDVACCTQSDQAGAGAAIPAQAVPQGSTTTSGLVAFELAASAQLVGGQSGRGEWMTREQAKAELDIEASTLQNLVLKGKVVKKGRGKLAQYLSKSIEDYRASCNYDHRPPERRPGAVKAPHDDGASVAAAALVYQCTKCQRIYGIPEDPCPGCERQGTVEFVPKHQRAQ